jgi:hypothetical protein
MLTHFLDTGIINGQNFEIHQMLNYLGMHSGLAAINYTAESSAIGPHCPSTVGSTWPGVNVGVTPVPARSEQSTFVSVCTGGASSSQRCLNTSVDLFASETGYYTFDGHTGPSPTINATVGETLVFEQYDVTNWYHPLGFAYYPDGAHGADWGAAELDEVEGLDQLRYFVNQTEACGPGDLGLDCYEPKFFFPRGEWRSVPYRVELTITPELAAASRGGVLFYFCHIHSKMSGRIVLHHPNGTRVTGTGTEESLYPVATVSPTDQACGTYGLGEFAPGQPMACAERFVCGDLDTNFEQCLQAMDCQMNVEMRVGGFDDHSDPVATFCQQMIPHHRNAVNMAKLLLTTAGVAAVDAVDGEGGFTDSIYSKSSAMKPMNGASQVSGTR